VLSTISLKASPKMAVEITIARDLLRVREQNVIRGTLAHVKLLQKEMPLE
jgi:hypothetical protein